MKVSTKGQYSLKVMLDFAEHTNEGFIRLRDVADRQGISKAYLEQIMVQLNKADLFSTARGYQGGYQLKYEPDHYRVGDILRITEGDIAPVEEKELNLTAGDRRTNVMVSDVWGGLEKVMVKYLDGLTLQDIINNHQTDGAWDFVI